MNAILSEIIKEGVLVEPGIAERISKMSESEYAELAERMRAEKPLILSGEFFENIIEVSEIQERKKISIQDSAARLNSYFNVLQNLFEKKNRAVSIANASGNVSVIGLVRKVLPDGFEIEDQTGAIKVVSKTRVDEDDVVMVAGKAVSKTLYADYVEFPDAPERQIRKSPKRCEILFGNLSVLETRADGGDYSISFGEKMSIGKNSLVVGKNPARVKINNIVIMVHNSKSGKNISPLQILKKRRLPETLVPMADVPDIFLLRGAENFLENYKGTTVIAVNDKSVARINLRTREVKFESI